MQTVRPWESSSRVKRQMFLPRCQTDWFLSDHVNCIKGTRKETGNEPNQSSHLLLGLQITGGFSFLLLLLLLSFCCREHKGAVQQRRTRIIKQKEEVPNHEDSHMESSLPMTVSTIYARIGEDTGQRQHRSESQTEYASISFS